MNGIAVEVSFHAWQSEVFGKEESPVILEEVINKGMTFEGLLNQLIGKYPALEGTVVEPESRRVYDHAMVILNDRVIDLAGGPQVVLSQGDKIQFIPMVAGG